MKITNLKSLVPVLSLILIFPLCGSKYETGEMVLPKVKEVNLEEIDPDQFAEEEWYMPYYLKHFSEMANSIIESGPNKGYIDISVWRSKEVNQPYDARIMENIMSLAWFYTQKRSWNSYYNDPALKARLEAALTFWINMQNEDGMFSEYAYHKWTFAPTAFATKFVGRALYLIAGGPEIDHEVFTSAVNSWRKALYISFTRDDLWEHGRNYTNQYANLWGGALMYLEKWPDPEIEELFRQRFDQSIEEFQSLCGFFYEKGGPDWGYNLSTHHSDLQVAWEFAKEKELQDIIIRKTKNWYDWFSYNALKEPDKSCYYLNRAIETRQRKGYYVNDEVDDPAYERWIPQSEFVPMARAFEKSDTEFNKSNKKSYQEMIQKYPEVAPLVTGEFRAFSPYAFLHQGMELWHPSDEQKKEAIKELPYFKNENFVQVRHDNRSNTTYTFIKRPNYYAIFNSGKIISEQQRYGLGLIWNLEAGTFFQSQSATDVAAFGTKPEGEKQVYEAEDLYPEFKRNHHIWNLTEGISDLGSGEFSVTYSLGSKGEKDIDFRKETIDVRVKHNGKFTEILPVLESSENTWTITGDQIIHKDQKNKIVINVKNAKEISSSNFQTDLYKKQCTVIEIKAEKSLEYEIIFE